jgi:sialic acid synthase SpsE
MNKVNIIAEIGWNFLGDMDLAKKMVKSCSENGARTAKFQYWNPSTLKNGSWDEDGRRDIYKRAALDEEKIQTLIDYCNSYAVNSLFSVFTLAEAKHLSKLSIEEIKIPSHEVANYELIEFCSKNFKKVFFSTGASIESEVLKSNEILQKGDCDYVLMHCVSSYPCNDENANLPRLEWLKSLHKKIGLSDHTQNVLAPAIAVSMGAEVIEKHFTTSNELDGRDNKFALDPENFNLMSKNIESTMRMMENRGKNYQDSEEDTVLNYRGRWG